MQNTIDIKDLSLIYPGSDYKAIDNMNISIEKGVFFGLLGPNGAGKTSLISMLTGLVKPSQGEIKIFDKDLSKFTKEIQKDIGVVPQEYALYPKLTARENLEFFGSMYGIKSKQLSKKIEEGIEKMGLTAFADKRIHTFSGGMKRRINLLAGVIHQPQLVFLDEPTVGVDVHSNQFIIKFLQNINAAGTTIVYTSHMLHEAEQLCTQLAIIDSGRIVVEGKTEELLTRDGKHLTLEEVFIENTNKIRGSYV